MNETGFDVINLFDATLPIPPNRFFANNLRQKICSQQKETVRIESDKFLSISQSILLFLANCFYLKKKKEEEEEEERAKDELLVP